MAKIVKKTYGRKFAWETGSSHAFDEAKLPSSKSPPSKIIRPSIWAKVPLIETFTSESPPRVKKRTITATKQESPDYEEAVHTPKKGKKRKTQDPFGFGDIDDEVLPALEYISPKKKIALESAIGEKKSKGKKIKIKVNANSKKSPIRGGNDNAGSPKQKGHKAKKTMSHGSSSSDLDGFADAPSPRKRGRPPKNSVTSFVSPTKDKSQLKANGAASISGSKKRGRPRKDSIESPLEQLLAISKAIKSDETRGSPSSKKRGRPAKTNIQSPPVREFNKSKVLTPGEGTPSPGPKKRGRPPKKSMESTMSHSSTMQERVLINKKNKSQNQQMKGRSSNSQTSSPVNSVKINKNSNNKKSPKNIGRTSGKGIFLSNTNGSTESSSPRKRGRPPKSFLSPCNRSPQDSHKNLNSAGSSATPSPKKRGRPPKTNHKSQTPLSSAIVQKNDQPQQIESGKDAISPVPKRRGRPPKSPISTFEVPLPVKKTIVPSLDKEISEQTLPDNHLPQGELNKEESTLENILQIIDEAPLIKKKRGRKPKNKPAIKNEVSSPDLSQETSHSTDLCSLSETQLSSEAGLSKENTISSRQEVDSDGTIDQTSIDDISRKVRFSTDTRQQEDAENDISSSRSSTASNTGSPFKWFLKNNKKTLSPRKVAQLRRMSVLPTCTPQRDNDDDDDDDDDSNGDLGAIPFSLSWAIQQDDNAVRVNKDDKELFTIVRNTKQAQESVEFGESQQFKDDIEYLLDGISDASSLSTRCLSLIELASKCSKSAFRMNLRAHGTVNAIFQRVSDAPAHQSLALCTSSVMFMLTRDRLSIDFDKSILEIMLKLLAMEGEGEEARSKEWDRLTAKIRAIFEKHETKGVNNLDLAKLTTESLARESLLSLTLQRTGSWFKDEIRLLGGLDHVVDTVVSCSKVLKVDGKAVATESSTNVRQIERCLKLLENVTVQCQSNQGYLISYRDSALLETCSRLLLFSVASLIDGVCEYKPAVQALWFSTMKILLNLTHDNELASTRFCQKSNVLSILLKSALQLPSYLPSTKQFDVIVLSLGLLINLVEYSKKNLLALNAAILPPLPTSADNGNSVCSEKDDACAVESLMQLFVVRLEAAKANSGMEEDLAKLNSSLHSTSIRIGSDGVSVICGDDLDNTAAEEGSEANDKNENTSDQGADDTDATGKCDGKTSSEKEAEHLGKALQKAGQHMEDSLIASYAALLIGLLCEDNKENQQCIHEKLQYGDFGIMTHTLDKFLAFMNMTASSSSSSSAAVIRRAIHVLQQCKSDYPANLPPPQMTS